MFGRNGFEVEAVFLGFSLTLVGILMAVSGIAFSLGSGLGATFGSGFWGTVDWVSFATRFSGPARCGIGMVLTTLTPMVPELCVGSPNLRGLGRIWGATSTNARRPPWNNSDPVSGLPSGSRWSRRSVAGMTFHRLGHNTDRKFGVAQNAHYLNDGIEGRLRIGPDVHG